MASWGGDINRWSVSWGIEGAVINGAIRDVSDVERVGDQVFYKGLSPETSLTRYKSLEGPTVINNVTVERGDLIVGDRMGVVVIPEVVAEATLKLAKRKRYEEERWFALGEQGASQEEILAETSSFRHKLIQALQDGKDVGSEIESLLSKDDLETGRIS